jgi:hypothetical protein
MRIAAWLVVVFTLGVGVVGLVAPDRVTMVRRQYFATPARLYVAGALRVAMGLVVFFVAPKSRAPKILRVLGVLMCMQGLAATLLFGPDRARAVMEWETMQGNGVLRVGAAVALASGVFMAFAISGRHLEPRED